MDDLVLNRLAGLQAIVNRILQNAIERIPSTEPKMHEQAEEAYTALSKAMISGDLKQIDDAWLMLDELIGRKL